MLRRTLLISLVACVSHAETHRLTGAAFVEAWNDDDRPMHGAVILAYDLGGLPDEGRFGAEFNTDTLRLSYDARPAKRLWTGVELSGEAFVAGLLPDYFVDGRSVLDRGFQASYARGRAYAKAQLGERSYFELEFGARRWFFGRADDTDPNFELPPDTWVMEPRLRFTWWGLGADEAWSDRHRLYSRDRGVAFGLEGGLDFRDDASSWGARDPRHFEEPDRRNRPEPVSARLSQWALTGWQALPWLRCQLREQAGMGAGEDDLTRTRIGGMNPYSLWIPGTPWAHYLSEDYLGGSGSLHFGVVDGLELGPLLSAVVLRDPHRTGADEAGVAWGAGLLVDWRFGAWQVDARGGFSPSLADASGEAAWSALAGVGYALDL